MSELLTFSSLLAFVALSALEIVLGVDNLVFIAILTGRLPPEKRAIGAAAWSGAGGSRADHLAVRRVLGDDARRDRSCSRSANGNLRSAI